MKQSDFEYYTKILALTTLTDIEQMEILNLVEMGNKNNVKDILEMILANKKDVLRYQLILKEMIQADRRRARALKALAECQSLIKTKTGKLEFAIENVATCDVENIDNLIRVLCHNGLIRNNTGKYELAVYYVQNMTDLNEQLQAQLLEIVLEYHLIKDKTGKYEEAIGAFINAEENKKAAMKEVVTNYSLIKSKGDQFGIAIQTVNAVSDNNLLYITRILTNRDLVTAKPGMYEVAASVVLKRVDNKISLLVSDLTSKEALKGSISGYHEQLRVATGEAAKDVIPANMSLEEYQLAKSNLQPASVKSRILKPIQALLKK